ncbi:hypothetical protein [Halogeometricum limi]|uniref:Uncharacterized protein n=1 Tax=Halogeometricum limi TaxID=555875 RepID=A0A1I6H6G2_9EURY|nr:hypothetical protein [Halogeometricum limi]SFR50028.1 hypothetical protein SAMN04488124_1836 [Halogeometricum limi]
MDEGGSPLSRRRFLGASVAGIAALAGCGGVNAQNDRPDDTASLGYVRLLNRHEEAHVVHVLVERGDEVVFWSSYDLPGAAGELTTTNVDGPWVDETGEGAYRVYFRVDDRQEWKTFSTAESDLDCYGLEARVNDGAGLGLWVEHQPDVCTEATTTETES